MKYLCFLAYLLINLVNCRFFVTSDYSLQKQVQYILFCFYAAVFIKLKLRPDGVISVTQCCHILNPTQPYL